MEKINPAFSALFPDGDGPGDYSAPVTRQNPTMVENALALQSAIAVCTPLLNAALNEALVEPEEMGEAVDAMLTESGLLVASVERGLVQMNIEITPALSLRIRELCVHLIGVIWRQTQESPPGLDNVLLALIDRLMKQSSNAPSKNDDDNGHMLGAMATSILIRNGLIDRIEEFIAPIVDSIQSALEQAITLFNASEPSISASNMQFIRTQAEKVLCEIIHYDHIGYLADTRKYNLGAKTGKAPTYDIHETIRRFEITWKCYISALSESYQRSQS